MSSGNFLFFLLLILGPVFAVSSSNWIFCWVGLELSFLGLIPMLLMESSESSVCKESSMKYFCVQAVGSGLLLCGGIMLFSLSGEYYLLSSLVFGLSLLIKLGIFPFHFWVPSVVSGLSWFPMFMMLTWQKMPMLFLMTNLVDNMFFLGKVILLLGGLTALVGALIGLNQTKVSPMLGSSSISHGGWMLVGMVHGGLWVYFLLYCFAFSLLIFFLMGKDDLLCGLGILSLSGLPPFMMFLGKWSVIKFSLFLSANYWYLALPLLSSVISLFFYLKFFYSFYLEQNGLVGIKSGLFLSTSVVSLFGVGFIYLF